MTAAQGLPRRRALTFFAYFAGIAAWGTLQLYVHLSTNSPIADLIWSDPQRVIERFGAGDAGSYLALAVDLSAGTVQPENLWILNLWPPGMAAVNTVLLWLPGPILPKLAIVSVAVWAAAGASVAVTLQRRGSLALAVGFVVAWSVSAPAIGWVFGLGFTYTDGIGAALLTSALLSTFLGFEALSLTSTSRRSGLSWIFLGGALTGLSMYFRWALAGAVAGVSLFALAIALVSAIALLRRRRIRSLSRPGGPRRRLLRASAALVFALGTLVVVGPWTTFVSTTLHPGDPSWSMGDFQWAHRWLTDEQLKAAPFLVEGNANWACEIAPGVCSSVYNDIALDADAEDFKTLRNAALQQVIENPGPYLANRADVFYRGWFSNPSDGVGSFSNIPSGIFFAAMLIALIALSVKTYRRAPLFITGVWVSLAGMVAIIAVAHLEARYLISIQATVLVSACLIATMTGWRWLTREPAVADPTVSLVDEPSDPLTPQAT